MQRQTPISDVEAPAKSIPSYSSFGHASAAKFLTHAAATGILGSGPAEQPPSDATPLRIVLQTVPWRMLVAQLFWSSAVMMVVYAFADQSFTSLSVPFWTSSFLISSSVVYGVGWALFVLLGFFIREASSRHRTARTAWNQSMAYARITIRQMVQVFAKGLWHPNDQDRIIAHFLAYPIALKMMIRGERERQQLDTILHPLDVDDVIQSQDMHIHCIRVIRGYFSCSETDVTVGFQPASPSTAGICAQFSQIVTIDVIDNITATITRIAEFKPALGYVNHLRIFLYIWLFFLPLALIETSGWFTPLWAVLITYGIGMLFIVATALNEPFGFDVQDIRLNRLASADALRFLNMYHEERTLPDIIKIDHNTPHWLEEERLYDKNPVIESAIVRFFKSIPFLTFKRKVVLPLLVFIAWQSFIVFLTRGIAEDSPELGCRWWCLYIPLSVSTTSYVGLGVFLLMGFWINDAYARYSTGLQLWESTLKPAMTTLSIQMGMMCKNGTWHNRDIERLFSHIVAIAYAGKQRLRESRDLSDFKAILAPEDIKAMSESKDLVDYCLRVLYGYISSIDRRDRDTVLSGKRPISNSLVIMFFCCHHIENAINACSTMRVVPISPSFTLHLHLFSIFWLILLPLAFVQQNGFFSYLYLPPIAYSIVKLLVMGNELSDPFGTDPNDIPLDKFCAEIKDFIHDIYKDTRNGPVSFVHESSGYEERFNTPLSKNLQSKETNTSHMTLKQAAQMLFSQLPSVPWIGQILVMAWIVSAVFISYGLSFTWDDERRNTGCREWCSPIDVDKNILLETGFALFLILSFRASDAMRRYHNAGSLISKLEMELRASMMEVTDGFQAGLWHKSDKPRFISHLMQIPLLLRDEFLGTNKCDDERLLSDEDYRNCLSSSDPVRHCIETWEAYLLSVDVPTEESGLDIMKKKHFAGGVVMFRLFGQSYKVGNIVSQLRVIKRFPVVRSYTNHQRLFTILWLVLLPLGMTARTGFLTILWASLISYGILALESLATTLVDPLGDDELDLPINKMFTETAERLIEAVRSTKCDFRHHIVESPVASDARIGTYLDGMSVKDQYCLPKFTEDEVDAGNFAVKPVQNFCGPKKEMIKPTLFAHMIRSVPWWVLLAVATWTALSVLISYLLRTETEDVRWWESRISIDGVVVTYVGFPAFLLLGFYVQAAFDRYSEAGNVWGDDLRASCHSLAVQWFLLDRSGIWHDGDSDRVIAHLAAVPIALKMELRDERDLRELKGLLSEDDIGKIMAAESMSEYCVDVIRAYYLSGICHPEQFASLADRVSGTRSPHLKFEIENLQEALRQCKFLKSFPIAHGFMILLRALIGIWFILVPFVLSESNGWFAILWVPIIGYGLLGMYTIADEIQQPFGRDLNDFDLDKMADTIVSGILFVRQNYRGGCEILVVETVENSGKAWENFEEDSVSETIYAALSDDGSKKIGSTSLLSSVSMILHAVPLWMLVATAVYSALSVLLAWAISQKWPLNESCSPAFCVPIAIDGVVKEYVGFALFLLLGFRLYDSHWRYVTALAAWRDEILSDTILMSNRIFELFPAGAIHKGDFERIAAHFAAFSIVTAARLRKQKSCAKELNDVMNAEDIARIERVTERGDYCIDVIRGYLSAADKITDKPVSPLVLWILFFQLGKFKNYAAECERMISIPLPFGYVQHIRIFLVIWLLTLPLGLVETSGWWTILWVVIIAYGVIGIERWSAELADPFGTDLSDLPLGKFRVDAVQKLRINLRWFYNGNGSVVKPERKAFPSEDQDMNVER